MNLKYLLASTNIFETASGATVNNEHNQSYNDKSIELKNVFVQYYKSVSVIKDAIVNHNEVINRGADRPKSPAQSMEPFNIIKAGYNLCNKSVMINFLEESEIKTVYRVIESFIEEEDEKKTFILFGMAKNKLGENFFWITQLNVHVSDLIKLLLTFCLVHV